jgi:uncharacterized membrane protein YbhN (UPF0104 family)
LANDEKQKKTSHLSIILRLLVAAAACWLIFKDINPAELGQTFKRLHFSIFLLALAVFMLCLCIISLRWWLFMRAQKVKIPLFLAVKLVYLGQFFTNFMPSAVGGDLIRAWYVSKHTDRRLQAALSVLADRVMGLMSTFILAISAYLIFMRGENEIFSIFNKQQSSVSDFFSRHPISWGHVLCACLFLVGCVYLLAGIMDLKGFLKKLLGHLSHLIVQFKDVGMVYVRHPIILVFGLSATIFLQSLMIVALWLIGRDLDMPSQIQFYFVFFPMMWVVGSLPLSIAGIGILEGGLVILFVQFAGAEKEAVMALALCQRLIWVLASFPGMLVHLTGAHRRKVVSA